MGSYDRVMYWRMSSIRRLARALLCVGLAVGLWVGPSLPARGVDGTLGATSTGSVDINLSVPNLVMISGLDDVNLGTWSGTGRLQAFEFACTFSNTGNYRVIASSANGQGIHFRAINGSGALVRYLVHWRDSNNFQRRLRHTQQSVQFAANATAPDCLGTTNTRIRIRIRANWLAAAPSGVYQDTLTILIQPD